MGWCLMANVLITKLGIRAPLDVFGPTVAFVTSPKEADGGYCVMLGTIPPGVSVPVHGHPDLESFYLIAGGVQALSERELGPTRLTRNAANA
jgi:hypothetical protein